MDQTEEKPKILVIEDDKFLSELLARHIPDGEWNLDTAFDGEEGLSKARSQKPDLIILDLLLPGIDGYEVLERLKKDPELAKIHVIILSNLGRKEEIERGLLLGAEDFLVKARFNLDEIKQRIKMIIEKKVEPS